MMLCWTKGSLPAIHATCCEQLGTARCSQCELVKPSQHGRLLATIELDSCLLRRLDRTCCAAAPFKLPSFSQRFVVGRNC